MAIKQNTLLPVLGVLSLLIVGVILYQQFSGSQGSAPAAPMKAVPQPSELPPTKGADNDNAGETLGVTVTLPALATVRLTVLKADDTPFPGAFVYIRHAFSTLRFFGTTDGNGFLAIPGVPEGTFFIQVRDPANFAFAGSHTGTVTPADDGGAIDVTGQGLFGANTPWTGGTNGGCGEAFDPAGNTIILNCQGAGGYGGWASPRGNAPYGYLENPSHLGAGGGPRTSGQGHGSSGHGGGRIGTCRWQDSPRRNWHSRIRMPRTAISSNATSFHWAAMRVAGYELKCLSRQKNE